MPGGVAGGYLEAQSIGLQNQLRQQALQEFQLNQAADAALYGGLSGGGMGAGPYGPAPVGAGPTAPPPPGGPAPPIPASPTGVPGMGAGLSPQPQMAGAPDWGIGAPPAQPQPPMTPQMPPQQPQMAGMGQPPVQNPMPTSPQQPGGSPPWQSVGASVQPASYQDSDVNEQPVTPQFAVAQAQQNGVPPDLFIKMLQSEGGADGRWRVGDSGTSFGPSQLHTPGGLGDEFRRDTGLDPRDPRNARAMVAWSARNMARTGWGPYHGAARAGIGPWQGLNREGMGGAPAGAGGPIGQGGYGVTLEQLIDRIERANPNLPPEVKLRAVARGMQLLQPESRQQFQLMLQMYRDMNMANRQAQQQDAAQTRVETQQQGADRRQETRGQQQQDAIAARGNVAATLQDKKQEGAEKLEAKRQEGRIVLEKLRQEGRMELATKRATDRIELQKMTNEARITAAKERGGAAGAKEYMTPEQQQKVAEYVAKTGDYTMLQGLGRAGADRAKIEGKLMDLGISPEDLQANRMESLANTESFKGLGRIQGRMSAAIEGTKLLEPPLREAMAGLWRTGIPTLDRIVRIANREIAASPEEVRFSIAIQSYLNKYADAMSKAYTTTDNARRHAYDLLKEHWSMGQLDAGIKQLDMELRSESRAVRNAMDEMRTGMGAKPRHGPGQMERGARGGETIGGPGWNFTPAQ